MIRTIVIGGAVLVAGHLADPPGGAFPGAAGVPPVDHAGQARRAAGPTADLMLASLDSLGGPRLLPPLLCGPHAVRGVWGAGLNSRFTGTLQDGVREAGYDEEGVWQEGGAAALSVATIGPAWQALVGTNSYTGSTTVGDFSALTWAPGASPTLALGRGALLCVDADLAAVGTTDYVAPAGLALTSTDGTGRLYVDGVLNVTAGATLTVTQAPPLYPALIVQARDGIAGSFAASVPAGYRLVQTASTVSIDIIR